jgi:hypothetical protein
LHGPATAEGNADVIIDFVPFATGGFSTSGFLQGTVMMTDAQLAAVADFLTYVNIHTTTFGSGEIRGQAVP